MQHGGLARAVRPNQTEALAFCHSKVDPVKNLHSAISGRQVFDGQKRVVSGKRPNILSRDTGPKSFSFPRNLVLSGEIETRNVLQSLSSGTWSRLTMIMALEAPMV